MEAKDFLNGTHTLREGLSSLAGGILGDAQDLVRQEVRLAKAEVREEFAMIMQASLSLVGAGVACTLTLVLLSLSFVFGIFDFSDGRIPLWGCYLIVALFLGIGGIIAYFSGMKKLKQVDFVPRKTVQTIKENYNGIRRSV